jgi:hypothetical protein
MHFSYYNSNSPRNSLDCRSNWPNRIAGGVSPPVTISPGIRGRTGRLPEAIETLPGNGSKDKKEKENVVIWEAGYISHLGVDWGLFLFLFIV